MRACLRADYAQTSDQEAEPLVEVLASFIVVDQLCRSQTLKTTALDTEFTRLATILNSTDAHWETRLENIKLVHCMPAELMLD